MTKKNRSPWGRANVSPSDWMGILGVEINQQQTRQASLAAMQNWLKERGFHVERTTLSRLRGERYCEKKLSQNLEELITVIINNVSVRSCVQYFEEQSYNSFKFFNPNSNPQSKPEQGNLPNGLYQSTRFSFSNPGKLVRSAFYFYAYPTKDERLSGYANNMTINQSVTESNVMRFKELRHITEGEKIQYQIMVGGFVFYNRGCFYLIGTSFETEPMAREYNLKVHDIRHVQMAEYILDDDNDPETIKGIKMTALRNAYNPAAAIIQLERVHNHNITPQTWHEVYNSLHVELGVFDVNRINASGQTDLKKYEISLNPSHKIDNEFNMLRVSRFT